MAEPARRTFVICVHRDGQTTLEDVRTRELRSVRLAAIPDHIERLLGTPERPLPNLGETPPR